MAAKYVTCRVVSRKGRQCTAEAVLPDAEIDLCPRHLAEAQRLLREAVRVARQKAGQ